MKKILWFLSVVLVLAMATGASADIRIDKSNTYSNDLGISSALDNYSLNTCVWAGSIVEEPTAIDYYTNKDNNAWLLADNYPHPDPHPDPHPHSKHRHGKRTGPSVED